MAEQFAFDERLGQRGAVECDKWTLSAGAVVMQGLGDQLFSGPAFPSDEYRGSAIGNLFDFGVDLLHSMALTDQIVKCVSLDDLCP